MERRGLKAAVLSAVVILASACGPRRTGAEGSQVEDLVSVKADPQRQNEPPPDAVAKRKRPWAHNTGPSDRSALTPSGSLKVTTDGAVLEDLDISGLVRIQANNVTLRNFRINATGTSYGISIESG
ncbi:hypothetical protein N9917_02180, partial [Deltaproteobacteria bacterium]|nr:hypothetical protein [Deltaproteobacteria bacterium]